MIQTFIGMKGKTSYTILWETIYETEVIDIRILDFDEESLRKMLSYRTVDGIRLNEKNCLEGTNGSLNRYTESSLVILNEIKTDDGKIIGYRVCNSLGKIKNLRTEDALVVCERQGIANGKVICSNNKKWISSIKGKYRSVEVKKAVKEKYTIEDFEKNLADKGINITTEYLDNEIAMRVTGELTGIVHIPEGVNKIILNNRQSCEELHLPSTIKWVKLLWLRGGCERVIFNKDSKNVVLSIDNDSSCPRFELDASCQFDRISGLSIDRVNVKQIKHENRLLDLTELNVKIIEESFNYFTEYKETDTCEISEIIFPDCLDTIHNSFSQMRSLTCKNKIKLGKGIRVISSSFVDSTSREDKQYTIDLRECKNLEKISHSFNISTEEVTLPDSNLLIQYSFNRCKHVEHLNECSALIEESFKITNVDRYIIRDSNKLIGYCFNNIVLMELDKNIQKIDSQGNSIVQELRIHNLVKEIKGISKNTRKITFEEGSTCTKISSNAFNESSIEEFISPSSIKEIEDEAFYDSKIPLIVLNEGLITIGTLAFYGCANTKCIIFPKSLENIGENLFRGCGSNSLQGTIVVVYRGTKAEKELKKYKNIICTVIDSKEEEDAIVKKFRVDNDTVLSEKELRRISVVNMILKPGDEIRDERFAGVAHELIKIREFINQDTYINNNKLINGFVSFDYTSSKEIFDIMSYGSDKVVEHKISEGAFIGIFNFINMYTSLDVRLFTTNALKMIGKDVDNGVINLKLKYYAKELISSGDYSIRTFDIAKTNVKLVVLTYKTQILYVTELKDLPFLIDLPYKDLNKNSAVEFLKVGDCICVINQFINENTLGGYKIPRQLSKDILDNLAYTCMEVCTNGNAIKTIMGGFKIVGAILYSPLYNKIIDCKLIVGGSDWKNGISILESSKGIIINNIRDLKETKKDLFDTVLNHAEAKGFVNAILTEKKEIRSTEEEQKEYKIDSCYEYKLGKLFVTGKIERAEDLTTDTLNLLLRSVFASKTNKNNTEGDIESISLLDGTEITQIRHPRPLNNTRLLKERAIFSIRVIQDDKLVQYNLTSSITSIIKMLRNMYDENAKEYKTIKSEVEVADKDDFYIVTESYSAYNSAKDDSDYRYALAVNKKSGVPFICYREGVKKIHLLFSIKSIQECIKEINDILDFKPKSAFSEKMALIIASVSLQKGLDDIENKDILKLRKMVINNIPYDLITLNKFKPFFKKLNRQREEK